MKQSHIEAIAKAKLVEVRQSAHLSYMRTLEPRSVSVDDRQAVLSHIKSTQEQVVRDRY